MTPPPLAARLATWSLFGPGLWANRDQHWSRVIGPGCRTGTEGPYEPGQYGGLSTSEYTNIDIVVAVVNTQTTFHRMTTGSSWYMEPMGIRTNATKPSPRMN